MSKNEICQMIAAVCRTLDGGITVSGATNAGNLAGCFTILQETLDILNRCEIVDPEGEKEVKSEN